MLIWTELSAHLTAVCDWHRCRTLQTNVQVEHCRKHSVCLQAFQGEYGVEMRHMWGMTELSPIGSCAGFKVGPCSYVHPHMRSHAYPHQLHRHLAHPNVLSRDPI